MNKSQEKLEELFSTKSLEIILQPQKLLVKAPINFYKKVEYLCKKISTVEWSGILLYTYEGTLKEPENFIITLRDIILMDKGTQGATNYSYNNNGEDFYIDYMEKYPERRSWKIGHIHSHNSMSVFFSGTDTDELKENAPLHNFYLSLIVNNKIETCCKLCFMATSKNYSIKIPMFARDEKGELELYTENKYAIQKSLLITYDCNVEMESEETNFEDFFTENVNKVLEKSTRSITVYSPRLNYDREDIFYPNKKKEEKETSLVKKTKEEDEYFLKNILSLRIRNLSPQKESLYKIISEVSKQDEMDKESILSFITDRAIDKIIEYYNGITEKDIVLISGKINYMIDSLSSYISTDPFVYLLIEAFKESRSNFLRNGK